MVVSEVPELYRKLREACRKNFPKFHPNPRKPLPLTGSSPVRQHSKQTGSRQTDRARDRDTERDSDRGRDGELPIYLRDFRNNKKSLNTFLVHGFFVLFAFCG